MRFRIVVSSQEFTLKNTERNQLVVDKIREGIHPGLVTLDTTRGLVSVNLSEAVPFMLFKNKSERAARPDVVVL